MTQIDAERQEIDCIDFILRLSSVDGPIGRSPTHALTAADSCVAGFDEKLPNR